MMEDSAIMVAKLIVTMRYGLVTNHMQNEDLRAKNMVKNKNFHGFYEILTSWRADKRNGASSDKIWEMHFVFY